MLPVGNESSRTSLSSVGAAFLKFWTVLTLVGLLLYVASVLSFREFAWFDVGAIACVTAALAVLLAVEEGSNDSQADVANMTLAGCVYLLLTKHMIALGITVFAIAGGVAGAYYIISSLVSFEYQGGAGALVIKLPGQTVYYQPLHPYGWEDTRIQLNAKQTFEVEIAGRVSPGLMGEMAAHVAELGQFYMTGAGRKPALDDVLWGVTGPGGYSDAFYDRVDPSLHYRADSGLTVRGRRHNEVIGVIVGDGELACQKLRTKTKAEPSKTKAEPCKANDVPDKPGYDATDKDDADQLYFLSSDTYPLKVNARKSGRLWLTVNDADKYRFDNSGLFFVTVTIR